MSKSAGGAYAVERLSIMGGVVITMTLLRRFCFLNIMYVAELS